MCRRLENSMTESDDDSVRGFSLRDLLRVRGVFPNIKMKLFLYFTDEEKMTFIFLLLGCPNVSLFFHSSFLNSNITLKSNIK